MPVITTPLAGLTAPAVTKTCPTCRRQLPRDAFHVHKGRLDGLQGVCRECAKASRRASYARNPDLRSYYAKQRKQWARDHPQRTKDFKRTWYLKHKYGLKQSDYDRLFRLQAGLCAICGRVGTSKSSIGPLDIDHDHATGRVRGLLCVPCNVGLGLLEDLSNLPQLLRYLEIDLCR